MKGLILLVGILASLVLVNGCTGVCGTHTETYESSAKGCDQMSNCRCIHNSWGGLGSCDSCSCTREVSNC